MANDDPFLFYSALYGRPVLDPDGNAVGRLDDLAVTLTETFPAVTALLIRRGRVESFRLTARWRDVESLDPAAVRLRVLVERLVPGRRLPSEPSFWVGQVLLWCGRSCRSPSRSWSCRRCALAWAPSPARASPT